MTTSKKIALGDIIIAFAAVVIALLVPLPTTWTGSVTEFYMPLAASLFFCLLNCGGALLFLSNLHSYKPDLRRAYRLIVVGIVLNAVASMQIPITNILNGWQSGWITKGGVGLPFFLSSLLLYFGVRSLAGLVGMPALLAKLWVAFPSVIVLAAASFFLPHVPLHLDEIAFDMSNMVATICTFLYLWSAIIVFQIRGHIGAHYVKAISWLSAALFVVSSVSVFIIVNALLTGAPNGMPPATAASMVSAGILVFCAGYAFSQTANFSGSASRFDVWFGGTNQTETVKSALELVIQTAELVSQPTAVDPILDPVRTITSHLEPGQTITSNEEQTLLGVYLQLEDYLATKELLRTFSKDELRKIADPDLQRKITTYSPTKAHQATA